MEGRSRRYPRVKPWGRFNALFYSLGAMACEPTPVWAHNAMARGKWVGPFDSQGFTLGYSRDRPIRGSSHSVCKAIVNRYKFRLSNTTANYQGVPVSLLQSRKRMNFAWVYR